MYPRLTVPPPSDRWRLLVNADFVRLILETIIFLHSATKVAESIKRSWCPSVCPTVLLSVSCPALKTVRFRTLIGNRKLEVELTDQRGRMATRSGQNFLEAEKLTSSITRKPGETESWSLLTANRKS